MGHSTILISLSLVTLLCGLSIAAYQLWSVENARQGGQHSALAARYGGKPLRVARQPEPTPTLVPDEPRVTPTTLHADSLATLHADADVITVPSPQTETPKKASRPPRRKPKPDITHNA